MTKLEKLKKIHADLGDAIAEIEKDGALADRIEGAQDQVPGSKIG